ncbi:MAG: hypothetical protein ACK42Z_04280, partial [Candidatus Kapaibacteriota bacterium]
RTKGLEISSLELKNLRAELATLASSIISPQDNRDSIESRLSHLFENIEKLLFGIAITKELTLRTMDRLLSYGEYLSSVILEEYLKRQNIDVQFFDSRNLIITDSNYGNAKPILEKTIQAIKSNLLPAFKKSNLLFLPGFIGGSETGTITTMGFESSNLTALLIASIINAREVIFWTDVPGIRTADPKIVADTVLIPEISFEDARMASFNGLKLIHPTMYHYFVRNPTIDYQYKSAFTPEAGTSFVKEQTKSRAKMILISEPYTYKEYLPEEKYELPSNSVFVNLSKEGLFLVEEKSCENIFEEECLSIISLLNFDTKQVFEVLSKTNSNLHLLYTNPGTGVCKIFARTSEAEYMANILHNFLVVKNK